MDPFAHLQEIKLIVTLALGYFCYRKLNSQSKSHPSYLYDESEEELS